MQAKQVQAQIMAAVAGDLQALDQEIVAQLGTQVPLVELIAQYIVQSGGKRMRPVMALLAGQALDRYGPEFHRLGVIIEFIHTATLLHDDVVDGSDLRRGRQTANLRWGNAPAILVGDFLYSRAFQIMVSLGNMQVMEIFAEATNRIAEGEVWQLSHVGNVDLDQVTYLAIIQAKTAELFSAATMAAAALAGQPADQLEPWRQYGRHLGTAFQLMDDVLDYQGDAEALGKNVGDDLAEGKMTLPLILLRQQGTSAQKDLVAQAISEKNLRLLEPLVAEVRASGALAQTQAQAVEQAELAKASLASLPASEAKDGLLALADLAVLRSA